MDNYETSWFELIQNSQDALYLKRCLEVGLNDKITNKIKQRLSELNNFCNCDLTETNETF
tara:strand:- start:285 stop:464 length:180 start_codon:yes stop_codon:yes gene_type:complete